MSNIVIYLPNEPLGKQGGMERAFISSAWARAARSAASSSNFFLKSATQRAGPSWPGSF